MMTTTDKTREHVKDNAENLFSQLDVIQSEEDMLDYETRDLIDVIFYAFVNGPVSVLGMVANVISIIIFTKQGFSESVNVSFCALAVSDLCSLIPLLWTGISFNPLFRYADVGFDSASTSAITGVLPHSYFCRIAGWITAFVTLERCVCVALPMKVKEIITAKRTLGSIAVICLILFATNMPSFTTIYLTEIFYNGTDTKLVGISYTDNFAAFGVISFSLSVFAQMSSLIFVFISTIILVLQLVSKSQWRHNAVSISSASHSMSSREKRVMKMVIFIVVIFIVCNLPTAVAIIMMAHFSSLYSPTGRYKNVYSLSWTIVTTVEAINSSTSILVYYNMSSKYKTSFHELFGVSKRLL